ncbi:hypothetical protein [[Mycoplasma] gypis]|uniref:DUF5622 domain-containing protein n=1 Tax=[Mycoplasma] gypis TaxID=92404 RepID=A0ABZ2RNP9_9BACT|nr:hypothetical protein [[Mycoplasma] gypis]MBN0919451.1 hypothetical protein [[Mycoplasma] gypis]
MQHIGTIYEDNGEYIIELKSEESKKTRKRSLIYTLPKNPLKKITEDAKFLTAISFFGNKAKPQQIKEIYDRIKKEKKQITQNQGEK